MDYAIEAPRLQDIVETIVEFKEKGIVLRE